MRRDFDTGPGFERELRHRGSGVNLSYPRFDLEAGQRFFNAPGFRVQIRRIGNHPIVVCQLG